MSTSRAPGVRAAGIRAPLLALGAVALVAGLWGGLVRLGLDLPGNGASPARVHGPLMVLGFLGTLISLERAVALGRGFGFLAPLAAGAGGLVLLADPASGLGRALLLAGGIVLVAAHVVIDRVQRSLHNLIMGLGALAWCGAVAWWLAGATVPHFTPLLAAFLVLTIVGERLELARMGGHGGTLPRAWLGGGVAILAAGLAVSMADWGAGVRIAGVGLLLQALWLARHDIARRTVRMRGLTRFMALALLAGYAWLAVAAVLWIDGAPAEAAGFRYDAALHAVFLGFVFSMVFAHAPVILPAVLRVPLPYHPRFYAHLVLLHASLVVRVVGGDLAGDLTAWRWGGVLGEVAIVLFLGSSALAAVQARRERRARQREARRREAGQPETSLHSASV